MRWSRGAWVKRSSGWTPVKNRAECHFIMHAVLFGGPWRKTRLSSTWSKSRMHLTKWTTSSSVSLTLTRTHQSEKTSSGSASASPSGLRGEDAPLDAIGKHLATRYESERVGLSASWLCETEAEESNQESNYGYCGPKGETN